MIDLPGADPRVVEGVVTAFAAAALVGCAALAAWGVYTWWRGGR